MTKNPQLHLFLSSAVVVTFALELICTQLKAEEMESSRLHSFQAEVLQRSPGSSAASDQGVDTVLARHAYLLSARLSDNPDQAKIAFKSLYSEFTQKPKGFSEVAVKIRSTALDLAKTLEAIKQGGRGDHDFKNHRAFALKLLGNTIDERAAHPLEEIDLDLHFALLKLSSAEDSEEFLFGRLWVLDERQMKSTLVIRIIDSDNLKLRVERMKAAQDRFSQLMTRLKQEKSPNLLVALAERTSRRSRSDDSYDFLLAEFADVIADEGTPQELRIQLVDLFGPHLFSSRSLLRLLPVLENENAPIELKRKIARGLGLADWDEVRSLRVVHREKSLDQLFESLAEKLDPESAVDESDSNSDEKLKPAVKLSDLRLRDVVPQRILEILRTEPDLKIRNHLALALAGAQMLPFYETESSRAEFLAHLQFLLNDVSLSTDSRLKLLESLMITSLGQPKPALSPRDDLGFLLRSLRVEQDWSQWTESEVARLAHLFTAETSEDIVPVLIHLSERIPQSMAEAFQGRVDKASTDYIQTRAKGRFQGDAASQRLPYILLQFKTDLSLSLKQLNEIWPNLNLREKYLAFGAISKVGESVPFSVINFIDTHLDDFLAMPDAHSTSMNRLKYEIKNFISVDLISRLATRPEAWDYETRFASEQDREDFARGVLAEDAKVLAVFLAEFQSIGHSLVKSRISIENLPPSVREAILSSSEDKVMVNIGMVPKHAFRRSDITTNVLTLMALEGLPVLDAPVSTLELTKDFLSSLRNVEGLSPEARKKIEVFEARWKSQPLSPELKTQLDALIGHKDQGLDDPSYDERQRQSQKLVSLIEAHSKITFHLQRILSSKKYSDLELSLEVLSRIERTLKAVKLPLGSLMGLQAPQAPSISQAEEIFPVVSIESLYKLRPGPSLNPQTCPSP